MVTLQGSYRSYGTLLPQYLPKVATFENLLKRLLLNLIWTMHHVHSTDHSISDIVPSFYMVFRLRVNGSPYKICGRFGAEGRVYRLLHSVISTLHITSAS